jgi:diguanylate cyclase (GGDEF)-like protein
MSFRARLTLFFVLIVIVPMLSVAIVLFRLIADNETGKADASVAARQRTAVNLYSEARARGDRAVQAVGTDRALAMALRGDRVPAARARARALLAARNLDRVVLAGGRVAIDVGSPDAIAPAIRQLVGNGAQRFGRLEVSTTLAADYAAEVKRVAGADVVVADGTRTLASTLPAAAHDPDLPAPGEPQDVSAGGRDYRAVTFEATGFLGHRLRIVLYSADASRKSAIARSRLLAAGILLGFLVLAMTFAVAVSRSLQAQIGSFLTAARRIAGGDFSTQVATTGRDEFAELGAEFNKMSRQLAGRVEDLRQERVRVRTAVRRIGEVAQSNLDRDALLEIVVRTVVDGLDAAGGRASARTEPGMPLGEVTRSGDVAGSLDTVRRAEAAAVAARDGREATEGDVYALAQPLAGPEDDELIDLLSVVRTGRPFDDADRELLAYFAATTGLAAQNVGLHEAARRQAITDELTGLFNHRRFQEVLRDEVERSRRFSNPVGLIMLDIDNFKRINDSYGHQQGDRVLAEVARVVRDSSRDLDSPARYGGEELAVVLPSTDLDGAYQLAERMRRKIEALELHIGEHEDLIRVTASFGVASLPESAGEARDLLAAADAALYEAKHAGRNKAVRRSR